MKRTQRKPVNRDGVSYVITTRDDETGAADILEYDEHNQLTRRCEWTHWAEPKGKIIGEASWSTAAARRTRS